jgi:uncharacterized membrane protein YbaN (DUF454 family)
MNPFKTFSKEWKKKDTKDRTFMVLGGIFLVAALCGAILPIVPQIPFAIISAFLFSKGSPKIHRWIRNNKHLGPPVKDWEAHQVVKPKLKIISTIAMVGGAAISYLKLDSPWSWIIMSLFLLAIIFMLTRKSKA